MNEQRGGLPQEPSKLQQDSVIPFPGTLPTQDMAKAQLLDAGGLSPELWTQHFSLALGRKERQHSLTGFCLGDFGGGGW